MSHPTQTHPYTIATVTAPDQPPLPAPDADEETLLASVADLGIDVRVWR